MDRPRITTAIPQRRYQIGEYLATVLAEIESPDPANYRYILAAVKEGEADPVLYVAAERRRRGDFDYRLRLIMEGLSDIMAEADEYGDLDAFCDTAITITRKALQLTDEEAVRL
jgi:hypothetical protein